MEVRLFGLEDCPVLESTKEEWRDPMGWEGRKFGIVILFRRRGGRCRS